MKFIFRLSIFYLSFGLISVNIIHANQYNAKLATRGITFNGAATSSILEAELCGPVYCTFVSNIELDMLDIDLGDDASEILSALQKMRESEKIWLFNQLNMLDNFEDRIYGK